MTIINSVVFLFLQHVLIVVKLILAFVIPDEPDWVNIKRQQIEYYSMKALKKLVMCALTAPRYSASVCVQYSCLWTFLQSTAQNAFHLNDIPVIGK